MRATQPAQRLLTPSLIVLGTFAAAVIAMRGCSPVDSTTLPHRNNAPNPTPVTVSPTPEHPSPKPRGPKH